jgi:hypothetical protein
MRRSNEARRLLSDLDARGTRRAHGVKDHPDPNLALLGDLGIAAAHMTRTRAEGIAFIQADAHAGFAWRGELIDGWLRHFLNSEQGLNKLDKLGRANAQERHLVVVYDSFTAPGVGIPLGLLSRYDDGAADYVMPSLAPPEPLSDLWLLPFVQSWEVLRWNRTSGWAILAD